MKYFTMVLKVPDDWKPGPEITDNPYFTAGAWSHVMDERDALKLEVERLKKMKLLGLHDIAKIQQSNTDVQITYSWDSSTDTALSKIRNVDIFFKRPNVPLWQHLMTSLTDGFDIVIRGTRNGNHDTLDQCYADVLDEVNRARAALGLTEVAR